MAYHYLNTIDDYNDNISILKEKLNIYPKVVYNITYTNNIINNDMYTYFFNEEILLNKLLEQQTVVSFTSIISLSVCVEQK